MAATALFLLAACASVEPRTWHDYLADRGLETPDIERFPHCRGYGCRHVDHLALTAADRAALAAHFENIPDAQAERAAIGPAIGHFEKIIGAKNGTHVSRGGTYQTLGDYQHDCVDNSINTTVYLELLRQQGWLRYHDIALPQSRFPLFGPHQTAVIADRETGIRYAVDAWFHDNGHPAEIVEFHEWFAGWRP